ncbi:MAG: CHAT domain-containing protein [bacterium]
MTRDIQPDIKESKPLKVFHIEGTCREDHLQIITQEALMGDESAIRHYDEIHVSMELVNKRCGELVDTLNKANRRGRMPPDVLTRLREIGQVFHDELFSLNIKDKLRMTNADYLHLSLDERLVQIPWELLHNGQQFFCRRFNMGRTVKTRQTLQGMGTRTLTSPLKMLILADPKGDLKDAYAEGKLLRDYMDKNSDFINATLRSANITVDSIKEKIRNFDIAHFAGHAEYDSHNPEESGWRLTDGNLRAKDIIKMSGTGIMPALIFSNGCQSARTEEWLLAKNFEDEIFGLANAFLLAGVQHYLGTFWEILDEPGSRFALEFYRYLLSGTSIGVATRRARDAMADMYDEESIVWASYVLYGNPTFTYTDTVHSQEAKKEKEPAQIMRPDLRAREAVIDFTDTKVRNKNQHVAVIIAGVIIVLASVLFGYPMLMRQRITDYEQKATDYYARGNYAEAAKVCEYLEKNYPQRSKSAIILGNIFFFKGDIQRAQTYFQKALHARKGSDTEKADAMMGLGRIASIEGRPDQAMHFYRKAGELSPGSNKALIAQACLLDQQEKYEQASSLFEQAMAISPDEHILKAVAREIMEKAERARSKEKQERIDTLVREFLDNVDKLPTPLPSDGWTSLPLSVWVMDFKSTGYSLEEGKGRLITLGIKDRLIKKSRVKIVERSILDKLMEELKIGSSKLADRFMALSIGRIIAARIMLYGEIVYDGPHMQVTFLLIETESGEVKAVVNELFQNPVPASIIANKVADILLEKFKTLYPLRGKITDVNNEEVILNIGQNHGVRSGWQFRVVGTDIIIETVAVQPNQSTALVKEGGGDIKPGLTIVFVESGQRNAASSTSSITMSKSHL